MPLSGEAALIMAALLERRRFKKPACGARGIWKGGVFNVERKFNIKLEHSFA